MHIKVLNKKALPSLVTGVTRVYVGRPSVLGNPFVIGRDGNRDVVIAKYRNWLYANLATPEISTELQNLLAQARKGPLELVCWCAPQACHADVIIRCLQWMGTQQ